LAISSAQAASNCGPRKESGSSAENTCAIAPFRHSSLRSDGDQVGRSSSGCTASNPDGPSIITSRAAAKVSPTSAMRATGLSVKPRKPPTSALTHSAPVRVLPAPRPPITSQIVQASASGSCAK
jgi:hypothetical protein